MSNFASWIHFGDLHIRGPRDEHYGHFLQMIDEANLYMSAGVDFALLPGDNADDGTEEQYRLVRAAVDRCRLPVHAITGDHDATAGNLHLFQQYLSPTLFRSFTLPGYGFVLLNSVAVWDPPAFGLGREQMDWLGAELRAATAANIRPVVFLHAYPSEHGADAAGLASLFRETGVLLAEMGHTHYNELANDGQTVYAATRSTGQVEEGPPGFSVTCLDNGAVSWNFKPMAEWPFAVITWPCDRRLRTDPRHTVTGAAEIRARVWGPGIERVAVSVAGAEPQPMTPSGPCAWSAAWDSARHGDGPVDIAIQAHCADGRVGRDRITAVVSNRPDYEHAIGAWPEKHIFGTQLGPNENGRKW